MNKLPPRKYWDTSRCPQCGVEFIEAIETTEKGTRPAAYCGSGKCCEINEAAAHLLNCGATGATFKEACDKLHKQYEEFMESK